MKYSGENTKLYKQMMITRLTTTNIMPKDIKLAVICGHYTNRSVHL